MPIGSKVVSGKLGAEKPQIGVYKNQHFARRRGIDHAAYNRKSGPSAYFC